MQSPPHQTLKATSDPVTFLDLPKEWSKLSNEIEAALQRVFQSQCFILGPELDSLEREIALFCGCRCAVGVGSGTDALLLALRALGIQPGNEVIVPAFSFFATAECVSLLGATPVFVDIQPDTFTMDPTSIASKLTSRSRAIIPVHLYGQSADLDPILALARQHNLIVIEDNAQALGAKYHEKTTGTLGDAGCISFYPTKNLGAFGDAGMILTNSESVAADLRSLRNHGSVTKYINRQIAYNSRLDEIQAAVLRVKLCHLAEWNCQRLQNALQYNKLLHDLPGVITPKIADWGEHVFHQYTIRVAYRDSVQARLNEHNISSQIYYPLPLHLQPAYSYLNYKPTSLPEAAKAADEVLSLPIHPQLDQSHIIKVASALRQIVESL